MSLCSSRDHNNIPCTASTAIQDHICCYKRNKNSKYFYEEIATKIKNRRLSLKISQKKSSHYMNVSLPKYRRYESGQQLPRAHHLISWALKLGILLAWLFFEKIGASAN